MLRGKVEWRLKIFFTPARPGTHGRTNIPKDGNPRIPAFAAMAINGVSSTCHT